MNPVPNKLNDEDQRLIDEYLKNGGTVTKGKPGAFSSELGISNNQWGQRRPKQTKEKGSEE
jgi:hypothetical protein